MGLQTVKGVKRKKDQVKIFYSSKGKISKILYLKMLISMSSYMCDFDYLGIEKFFTVIFMMVSKKK